MVKKKLTILSIKQEILSFNTVFLFLMLNRKTLQQLGRYAQQCQNRFEEFRKEGEHSLQL